MTNLSLSGIRFHPQNWTFRFPFHTAIDYFLSGLDWVWRFPADVLIRCRVPLRWTLERKADRCQRIFQKTKILRPRSLSAKWTMPIVWLTPRHEICRFTRREAHRPLVKQDVKPTSLFPRDATIFFWTHHRKNRFHCMDQVRSMQITVSVRIGRQIGF